MSTDQKLPTKFCIGKGNTIVSITFVDGIIQVSVTRNSSDMVFIPSHQLTDEEYVNFKKQVEQIPDAVFEFENIELGINFYASFFVTYPQRPIDRVRSQIDNYNMSICC